LLFQALSDLVCSRCASFLLFFHPSSCFPPSRSPFASEAPLCDETAKTNDPCPLQAGHHNEVSKTQSTVTGKVVTTLTWYDQDGNGVLCAVLTTKSS
jgi:hypothetical protein